MRRIISALAVAGMIAVGMTGTAAQAHDYGWGGYGWHQRAWQEHAWREHAWREQAWREQERHERDMRTAAIICSVVPQLFWAMSHH